MAEMPVFDVQLTEVVCNILAATEHPGLTASELNSALRPAKLREATSSEERREALRLIDLAHDQAVDVVEDRDAGESSVRSFPAGFSGGR